MWIPIRKCWQKIWLHIPEEYRREFLSEQFYINFFRIRVFGRVIAFLLAVVLVLEMNYTWALGDAYWLLVSAHLALLGGLLLILSLIWLTFPASNSHITGWHQFLAVFTAGFVLVMCAVVSGIDQFQHASISAYILGCFGIANIICLKPGTASSFSPFLF